MIIEEQGGHSHSLAFLRSLEEINGQKSVLFVYCIGSVHRVVKLEAKFTFPAVVTFYLL